MWREWREKQHVALVAFEKGERKDDVAQRRRAQWHGGAGVVLVGSAQEKEWAFAAAKRVSERGLASFDFQRKQVFVKHYYFYFEDEEWGPGFLKGCSYFPFAMKLCLNGHEWAKKQARKKGLEFTALDNGFGACAQPARLQKLCDRLSERDIEGLLRRLRTRIPWPWSAADQRTGYDWKLSIWQMETSLTQVFDQPRHGRELFESIIRDNLDLDRPERVALVVDRKVTARTPGKFATRIITRDIHQEPAYQLQALRDQTILQGKPRPAHRNDDQQHARFRCRQGVEKLLPPAANRASFATAACSRSSGLGT